MSNVDLTLTDAAAATASRRTLGNGAQQAAAGTQTVGHPHAKITVAAVAPTSPATDDIWLDTSI
jgi:hypothetical protein